MPSYRPTPPPYGTTPDYVLAPPRAEDRLNTLAFPPGSLLPPPRPEDRLPFVAPTCAPPLPYPAVRQQEPVSLPDRRRLEIQAALTAAGVAPADGDPAAMAELAGLSEATVRAVLGWIGAAARASRPRPHAV
ncbi:hypothetical protein ACFCVY_02015 [Streptomyces sp. NPDC056411]|uniref:hypothetical protein n=1 Tax=Streptomyces sp. NPDC056411 TaxID=3345813 RepID=UPI0035D9B59E